MKNKIFIFSILFLTGCSSFDAWNTPYIDTKETLQLKYGMDKSKVLQILGYPLVAASGWPIDNDQTAITWVYEVRSINVQSQVSMDGTPIPVKTSSSHRIDGVVHRLVLVFVNNKLADWGPASEFDELVEEIFGDETSVTEVAEALIPPYAQSWQDNIKNILGVLTFGLSDIFFGKAK